jgi:glycosyltransferase involved in cell wall biosynthesis
VDERLRVLHAPINICGQPLLVSRGLRDLGHKSLCLVYDERRYERGFDINLRLRERPFWQRQALIWSTFVRVVPGYDIFHFHFAHSLLPDLRDLALLKALGKRIVMRFWGSDVRQPRPGDAYALVDSEGADFERRRRRLAHIMRYADAVMAGPNLRDFVPGAVYIPPGIELDRYRPVARDPAADGPVTIVHPASSRARKGSEHVVAAAEALRAEGADVELVLVENLPHEEAKRVFARADLAVEQLLSGWHGVSAVEFMALGVPVVAYIKPEHQERFPDLPIVSATPETITSVLRPLVADRARLRELGTASRAYVERVHDARVVTRRHVELYRSIL